MLYIQSGGQSIPMRASGRGKISPKDRLKDSAMSRDSSRCWDWSSPTGTMVDLVSE